MRLEHGRLQLAAPNEDPVHAAETQRLAQVEQDSARPRDITRRESLEVVHVQQQRATGAVNERLHRLREQSHRRRPLVFGTHARCRMRATTADAEYADGGAHRPAVGAVEPLLHGIPEAIVAVCCQRQPAPYLVERRERVGEEAIGREPLAHQDGLVVRPDEASGGEPSLEGVHHRGLAHPRVALNHAPAPVAARDETRHCPQVVLPADEQRVVGEGMLGTHRVGLERTGRQPEGGPDRGDG